MSHPTAAVLKYIGLQRHTLRILLLLLPSPASPTTTKSDATWLYHTRIHHTYHARQIHIRTRIYLNAKNIQIFDLPYLLYCCCIMRCIIQQYHTYKSCIYRGTGVSFAVRSPTDHHTYERHHTTPPCHLQTAVDSICSTSYLYCCCRRRVYVII